MTAAECEENRLPRLCFICGEGLLDFRRNLRLRGGRREYEYEDKAFGETQRPRDRSRPPRMTDSRRMDTYVDLAMTTQAMEADLVELDGAAPGTQPKNVRSGDSSPEKDKSARPL